MSAPFRVGMPAVYISDDPNGVRVERVAVYAVRPDGDGWLVETSGGTERVDASGEGRRLVPLESEMAHEFESRDRASYVISATTEPQEQDTDREPDWRNFEQELRREPEQGYGQER